MIHARRRSGLARGARRAGTLAVLGVLPAVGCKGGATPGAAPAPAGAPAAAAPATAADTLRAALRVDSAARAADSASRRRRPPVDVATAQRFEIVGVGDSTFTFLATRAPWLAPGMYGIAVDPRRRDVLVARFDVLARSGDSTTALVTGQTQRVSVDHVALVPRPADTVVVTRQAVLRSRLRFWQGILLGLAGGYAAGRAIR